MRPKLHVALQQHTMVSIRSFEALNISFLTPKPPEALPGHPSPDSYNSPGRASSSPGQFKATRRPPLGHVVVRCSTSQYVVVRFGCCSTLQYVVVRCTSCSTLYHMYVVVRCMQYAVVRCSMLQYVVVRCSTLWYVAVRCSALQYFVDIPKDFIQFLFRSPSRFLLGFPLRFPFYFPFAFLLNVHPHVSIQLFDLAFVRFPFKYLSGFPSIFHLYFPLDILEDSLLVLLLGIPLVLLRISLVIHFWTSLQVSFRILFTFTSAPFRFRQDSFLHRFPL